MKKINNYKSFLNQINNQKYFLMKIYATLILQILIAFAVLQYSSKINLINNKFQFYGIIIFMFIIIFILPFIDNKLIKLLFVSMFSICVGLLLSFTLDQNNPDIVEIEKKAFKTTIIIFIYTVLFGFFLSFMGLKLNPYIGITLFFALLLLIIGMFFASLTNIYSTNYKIFSSIAIFLFTCFIIYDTMNILERRYNNNFVSASFDYFLDIYNLFLNFMNLDQ